MIFSRKARLTATLASASATIAACRRQNTDGNLSYRQ